MKKVAVLFAIVALAPIMGLTQTTTNLSPGASTSAPRPGILLLAHGGSLEWNEDVRHAADQVDLQIPTEIAFGMATRSAMQGAIDRLVARKVTEIIAVPLFISSHSFVIDSQAYLLGLCTQMPEELKDFAAMDHGSMDGSMGHEAMDDPTELAQAMRPVTSPVPILMAAALDANPIVADILTDRAASISHDPAHEVVILVAHGPVSDKENKLWLHDMGILADRMRTETRYARIEYLTLRDDANAPVRNKATAQLRKMVEQVAKDGRTPLVVPLLLSYGGIEGGLRKRLDGLTYRMPSQALLPDKRIAGWIIATADNTSQAKSREISGF